MHLDPVEATVDPAPFDSSEMVDDAEQRDQVIVGPPTYLRLVEAIELSHDRAAKVTEPLEQQLRLIVTAQRKPDFVV